MANLPGLNGSFDYYPKIEIEGEVFKIVPFSDWLPSDFETVLCSRGGGYIKMWYSPLKNMMVFEDSGESMIPSDLVNWLRKK
ncbi:hypothetical protein [Citrobacter phage IME-JL8]|uniref:Uncharacterized protein n=1 Tax=Citrobacter phage IME-JL8 TaxID=2709754 RepID=A0A6G6XTF8_9CAUD|nr:hypothetical protein [Citrobacter phage IME-JL8]